MRFFLSQYLIASGCRSCKIILTLLWCFGFIWGVYVAACADNLASLMRACCDAGVSIVGLFFVPFLTFSISAAAVYCRIPLIVYLTGLCKSFLLGFCVCAVHFGFFRGGWMICALLLFTDIFTAPALFGFQLRYLQGVRKGFCRDSICCLCWFILVSMVDEAWIVPLLRDII